MAFLFGPFQLFPVKEQAGTTDQQVFDIWKGGAQEVLGGRLCERALNWNLPRFDLTRSKQLTLTMTMTIQSNDELINENATEISSSGMMKMSKREGRGGEEARRGRSRGIF